MSEQSTTPGGETPQRMWPRVLPAMLALLVIVAALSFVLFARSSKPVLPGGAEQSAAGSGYDGTLALPARPAPAIELRNYLGQPVTLSEYRGKAVLVTFLYANCPDICPLIASNLRVALNLLGSRDSRGPGHRRVGRSARRHAGQRRQVRARPRDGRQDAVPDRLGRGTLAHVGGLERRLHARGRPAEPGRALGARLRDQRQRHG